MNLVEIGQVRTTHGYAGEIKLIVDPAFLDDLKAAEFLFIGRDDSTALPYEIQSIRGGNQICKLAELETKEQSAQLRGQLIFLRETDIHQNPQPENVHATLKQLTGYDLLDSKLGLLGPLKNVVIAPHQATGFVHYAGRDRAIPLVAEFIREIKQNEKQILLSLPEGLLEL